MYTANTVTLRAANNFLPRTRVYTREFAVESTKIIPANTRGFAANCSEQLFAARSANTIEKQFLLVFAANPHEFARVRSEQLFAARSAVFVTLTF